MCEGILKSYDCLLHGPEEVRHGDRGQITQRSAYRGTGSGMRPKTPWASNYYIYIAYRALRQCLLHAILR